LGPKREKPLRGTGDRAGDAAGLVGGMRLRLHRYCAGGRKNIDFSLVDVLRLICFLNWQRVVSARWHVHEFYADVFDQKSDNRLFGDWAQGPVEIDGRELLEKSSRIGNLESINLARVADDAAGTSRLSANDMEVAGIDGPAAYDLVIVFEEYSYCDVITRDRALCDSLMSHFAEAEFHE
jgi:hypothetical protein